MRNDPKNRKQAAAVIFKPLVMQTDVPNSSRVSVVSSFKTLQDFKQNFLAKVVFFKNKSNTQKYPTWLFLALFCSFHFLALYFQLYWLNFYLPLCFFLFFHFSLSLTLFLLSLFSLFLLIDEKLIFTQSMDVSSAQKVK